MGNKLINLEECKICDLPRVVSINNDFAMKFPLPQICIRNDIDHNKENVTLLNKHFAKHFTEPAMAMTRSILKENAVELYNTVVETNMALKQNDIIIADIWAKIGKVDSIADYHKLMKNISDFQKRKHEMLQFHYKVTGKSDKDDIAKASLVAMVQEAGKQLGEEAVNEIKNSGDRKSIKEYIFGENEHLQGILDKVRHRKNVEDADYEVDQ